MDTADTSFLFETMCDPVEYYISACNPAGCGESATMTFPQGKDLFGFGVVHVCTFTFASGERI